MFDVPVDAQYVWLGVGLVSVVALGVVVGLPTGTAPDARALARAVDAVSGGPAGAHGAHAVEAAAIRLGPHRVGLRTPAGSAHASFAYGPIVPVNGAGPLRAVLEGRPPDAAFDRPGAFASAIDAARDRSPAWRPAPTRVEIRRVSWEGIDVTLVG